MHPSTDPDTHGPGSGRRPALALLGSTAALFVGAGGLLWWRQGAAVFGDVVTSALAWCF